MKNNIPSYEYINRICSLYNDYYDDRLEDSKPGGDDWQPGIPAAHKSMAAFQKELEEEHGLKLSRTKIQKILITGGRWTTERSRKVQELFELYSSETEYPTESGVIVRKIADQLGISVVSVNINLPYEKVVYGLEEKSGNAKRIERWRKKYTFG